MTTLERLGADELRRRGGRLPRRAARPPGLINRLNVYPVPDGDTGTNMALTLESVVAELDGGADADLAATCKAISHGSLMGARGNSGVILSQILRGLAVDGRREAGRPRRPGAGRRPCAAASDGGLRRGDAAGRGHDPHRRPRGGRGGRRPRSPTTAAPLVEVLEAALAPGPRRPGPHARACCRCWPRPGWSTPAAPASCCCSTPLLHVVDGRPLPEPPATSTSVDVPRSRSTTLPRRHGDGARRRRRPALRGHVLPRGARRDHPRVQGRVGRHRRLDRGGRRRRHLELPHPHRRHRRRDRGRRRHAAGPARSGSPTCMEQVEEERWVREAAGGRARRAAERRAGRHRRRGRGHRRRRAPHLPLARRAADRDRRAVDEPVDRAAARGGRGHRRPTRS